VGLCSKKKHVSKPSKTQPLWVYVGRKTRFKSLKTRSSLHEKHVSKTLYALWDNGVCGLSWSPLCSLWGNVVCEVSGLPSVLSLQVGLGQVGSGLLIL
jgi:hypothetical protein